MVKGKQIMSLTDEEVECGYPRSTEVTQKNFPQYKTGANRRDQNAIKQCKEADYDSFQTAHALGLEEKCVKAFWPKRTRRTPEQMAAEA
jgi:hypothetical protein